MGGEDWEATVVRSYIRQLPPSKLIELLEKATKLKGERRVVFQVQRGVSNQNIYIDTEILTEILTEMLEREGLFWKLPMNVLEDLVQVVWEWEESDTIFVTPTQAGLTVLSTEAEVGAKQYSREELIAILVRVKQARERIYGRARTDDMGVRDVQ